MELIRCGGAVLEQGAVYRTWFFKRPGAEGADSSKDQFFPSLMGLPVTGPVKWVHVKLLLGRPALRRLLVFGVYASSTFSKTEMPITYGEVLSIVVAAHVQKSGLKIWVWGRYRDVIKHSSDIQYRLPYSAPERMILHRIYMCALMSTILCKMSSNRKTNWRVNGAKKRYYLYLEGELRPRSPPSHSRPQIVTFIRYNTP